MIHFKGFLHVFDTLKFKLWSLQKLTEEKYEVQSCIPEAAILVCTTTEPKLTLKVTLTSPQMKDDCETEEQGLCLHMTNFLSFFISKQEVREGMDECLCLHF